MRRLTAQEYKRTVATLFQRPFVLDEQLPVDARARGFDNQADVQEPTPGDILGFQRSAKAVTAEMFAEDPSSWMGCDPAEDGCIGTFLETFGSRVFRRPLTDAELERYTTFFNEQLGQATPVRAAEMTVQGLLMSPSFLYLVETGGEEQPELLDGYAMASRLSYLLWNTMPDQALFDAAADGSLETKAGIREQAERLLADPQASDVVVDFYGQWSASALLDTVSFEDPQLSDSMKRSSEAFFRDWYATDASLPGLMTRRTAFVDDRLADFYGLPPVGGDELTEVELDPTRYAGLLTRPEFVSTHIIPPSRGATIMDAMLCTPLSFPAGKVPDPPQEGEDYPTQRAQFEAHAALPCATACHSLLDPLGFPFENYDQEGRWRDEDNGHPVNAVTDLVLPFPDLTGTVANAVELSEVIGSSGSFAACHSNRWFTYAYSRGVDADLDSCDIETLEELMVDGASVSDLLLALTTRDTFRYVLKREAQ